MQSNGKTIYQSDGMKDEIGLQFFMHSLQRRLAFLKNLSMECFTSQVSPDEINHLHAISSDSNRGEIEPMIEIKCKDQALNTPEELKAAREYFNNLGYIPTKWIPYLETGKNAPFRFNQTSFINLFGNDMAIMVDMYRSPWKYYFTSDVFLYQWLKANGKGSELNDLPVQFLSTIYIHNITNLISKYRFRRFLNELKTDHFCCDSTENHVWKSILATPHLKCVNHIIEAFNMINRLRDNRSYSISAIHVYRKNEKYHLKIKIK